MHAAYQSIVFESDEPMHPEWLKAFLDSRPKGVFRIKGYVHFGWHGDRELQVVGGFLRFRPSRSGGRRTSLVMIGLDMSGLEEQLVGCVGEGDERGHVRGALAHRVVTHYSTAVEFCSVSS